MHGPPGTNGEKRDRAGAGIIILGVGALVGGALLWWLLSQKKAALTISATPTSPQQFQTVNYSGRLTDKDGKGIANASITFQLSPMNAKEPFSDAFPLTTDANGNWIHVASYNQVGFIFARVVDKTRGLTSDAVRLDIRAAGGPQPTCASQGGTCRPATCLSGETKVSASDCVVCCTGTGVGVTCASKGGTCKTLCTGGWTQVHADDCPVCCVPPPGTYTQDVVISQGGQSSTPWVKLQARGVIVGFVGAQNFTRPAWKAGGATDASLCGAAYKELKMQTRDDVLGTVGGEAHVGDCCRGQNWCDMTYPGGIGVATHVRFFGRKGRCFCWADDLVDGVRVGLVVDTTLAPAGPAGAPAQRATVGSIQGAPPAPPSSLTQPVQGELLGSIPIHFPLF